MVVTQGREMCADRTAFSDTRTRLLRVYTGFVDEAWSNLPHAKRGYVCSALNNLVGFARNWHHADPSCYTQYAEQLMFAHGLTETVLLNIATHVSPDVVEAVLKRPDVPCVVVLYSDPFTVLVRDDRPMMEPQRGVVKVSAAC